MKEFKSYGRFTVPNDGKVAIIDYFEGYKDCIGEVIKIDDIVYKVIDAKQFGHSMVAQDREPDIGFLIEEINEKTKI